MQSYKEVNKFIVIMLTVIISQMFFSASTLAAILDYNEQYEKDITPESFNSPISKWDLASPDLYVGEDKKQSEGEEKLIENKDNYLTVLSLIKQKEFSVAQNKITALIKQSPSDPQLYNLQALISLNIGNTGSARQSYKKAIKLDANNINTYFGLATLAFNEKQPEKAKQYAEIILTINDKNVDGYFLLASIENSLGKHEKVEQVLLAGYKKMQGDIKGETRFITQLGIFYAEQKQAQKILPISEELVKRHPNNKLALSSLAGAQYINSQKKEAANTLGLIVQYDKKDIKHRLMLVKVLGELPEYDNRVPKILDEVFQINPASPQAFVIKTEYLKKHKKFQQALYAANEVAEIFPGKSVGQQLRGDAFLADAKYDKALEAYQKAYKIKPEIKILLIRADLLSLLGRSPDAIELLKQESGKFNNDLIIEFQIANLYQQQGDYKQAKKYYKNILAKQARHVYALNNLAWIYQLENNAEAVNLAGQAYKLSPNNAPIADTYGYILVKQGRLDKGLKILQEAAETAPEMREYQYHLAEAYSLTGNKQKAIAILESINKQSGLFPGKEESEQLLQKLTAG